MKQNQTDDNVQDNQTEDTDNQRGETRENPRHLPCEDIRTEKLLPILTTFWVRWCSDVSGISPKSFIPLMGFPMAEAYLCTLKVGGILVCFTASSSPSGSYGITDSNHLRRAGKKQDNEGGDDGREQAQRGGSCSVSSAVPHCRSGVPTRTFHAVHVVPHHASTTCT